MTSVSSLASQNYTIAAQDAINEQILVEQVAQNTYLSAAAYFGRDDVALPGLQKYFLEQVEQQGKRVQLLIDYQNMRGGAVTIKQVPEPTNAWASAQHAIETSLAIEKDINSSLLTLTGLAISNKDMQLKQHIKGTHLSKRVENIEKIAKAITQLQRVGGTGLGLHLWDAELYEHGLTV
ncbi:Stores iron in a soluble, non-toxic, readily available form [Apophysomyces ossiformis]|uniref:Ferritin n=1 Tax=Apophysomyces ossiformis TaxID=679940 RepID=A0A8H7EL92_9FUNG|nr:Stores iron in a soluble, non-toxic, readily available form [Apophysomyces ossiformis]